MIFIYQTFVLRNWISQKFCGFGAYCSQIPAFTEVTDVKQTHYDAAVIGGGPAGYAAALYCARAGLSTLVLEKLTVGGQLATTSQVDNYPGFADGVDGWALAEQMRAGAERFGAETLFAEATALVLAAGPKQIETDAGMLTADAVILANGAAPRPLGVPEEDALRGRGLSYCATCDGAFFRDKTVVVVGGGNSAAEDALLLARLCKRVYVVHRRDTLRATRSEQDRLRRSDKITLILDSTVTRLLHGDVVTGVTLRNVKTGAEQDLACDGVFVAVGRIPNTELLRGQIELDKAGYVLADETTHTNLPGIFAAGDLRQKPLRQIVTAIADGAVAALAAEAYLETLS